MQIEIYVENTENYKYKYKISLIYFVWRFYDFKRKTQIFHLVRYKEMRISIEKLT